MKVLTSLQEEFIYALSKSSLRDKFFLTGGTALAAFYLYHRYSEDMDFFTEIEGEVGRIVPLVKDIVQEIGATIDIRREYETFLECSLTKENERIRLDFAQDIPYRLQSLIQKAPYNIFVDNELDMACNKLSALFDRYEAKDFVDLYCLSKEFMDFWEIYKNARKKHIGMEEYWLAVSLKGVDKIEVFPRMIKPVTIDELKEFFYDKIKNLMERIKDSGKQG